MQSGNLLLEPSGSRAVLSAVCWGSFFSMNAITQHKDRLRQQLRQQRQMLTTTEQDAAANMIAKHTLALPQWARVSSVAIYLAADGEADPQPLARRALQQGKHLFLPVIQADNTLRFARWKPGDSLVTNL